MKLSDLRRISKYHHISEFTAETLVTGLGLYDCVLIDAGGISSSQGKLNTVSESGIHISVSKDVKTLHKFLNSQEPVTLPCPVCGKNQPFKPLGWFNGIDAINESNSRDRGIGYMRLFNSNTLGREDDTDEKTLLDRLEYRFGTDEFALEGHNSFDSNEEMGSAFFLSLAIKCIEGILFAARDFRKDYVCTLENSHIRRNTSECSWRMVMFRWTTMHLNVQYEAFA